MLVWLIGVYLAKAREPIADVLAKHHAISLNVILECYLGPRTKADRDFRIVRARKAVSQLVETNVSATSAGRVATSCKL